MKMAHLTQPGFGGPYKGLADNGGRKTSSAKDKSGFGSGKVDPGLRTPFVDAVFKK